MSDYLTCPFCKEGEFDLVGLKHHYESGYCNQYNDTMTIWEESELRRTEKASASTGREGDKK